MKINNPNKKYSGILMPVASLPTNKGIGGFGLEARNFIDFLSKSGVKVWQILPLNPMGFGNSPYQPFSSYAGDEIYIDLEALKLKDYLDKSENIYFSSATETKIDYKKIRSLKNTLLKKSSIAFYNSEESSTKAFLDFKNEKWVYEYAVFMAFREKNNMECWNLWHKEERDWIIDKKYNLDTLRESIDFHIFLQYEFFNQWNSLKAYANKRGILIMGDIPFYVGLDSLDVWSKQDQFLLDKDGRPTYIAGVPPDYFSKTGQRWGNPIYNWEKMEEDGFSFWLDRLKHSEKLYDIIRIDHFRAFDTYWKIPITCETAIEGEWIEAPSYKVLGAITEKLKDLEFVAEDLGDLRYEVIKLKNDFGLCGMNVLEFSILSDMKTAYNQYYYIGTHDNQTGRGWFLSLSEYDKKRVLNILKRRSNIRSISWKMLEYICKSKAKVAIMPMGDILELDDIGRINTPGTIGSPNWEWKMSPSIRYEKYAPRIKKLLKESNRI